MLTVKPVVLFGAAPFNVRVPIDSEDGTSMTFWIPATEFRLDPCVLLAKNISSSLDPELNIVLPLQFAVLAQD